MWNTVSSVAKKATLTLGFLALIAVFAGTSLKTVHASQGVHPLVCGSQSCYYNLGYICTNQGCSYCDPSTGYAWCAGGGGDGGGGGGGGGGCDVKNLTTHLASKKDGKKEKGNNGPGANDCGPCGCPDQ